MKVFVINGSPKGEKSNTMKLTRAVVDGICSAANAHVEQITLRELDIKPCLGCMSCWGPTAGRCVINDCMKDIYQKVMAADIIIESFPLFFFGMPGPMKNFTDRMMPLMETYRGFCRNIGNSAMHSPRYDMSSKRFVVISTCGYARVEEIYDALKRQLDFTAGDGHWTPLFCPQGEMFAIPKMKPYIDIYLKNYTEIGRLLGEGEDIPSDLAENARRPIIPQRAFEKLVSAYWDSHTDTEDAVTDWKSAGDKDCRD